MNSQVLQYIRQRSAEIRQRQGRAILFAAILALGIFARTWEYRNLPPGINPDEASNGVDAASLLHYGADRNGIAYPIKFVSWGGGQDALYGYLLVPFVAALGLTPFVVRLPMLISGILSLPLFYFVARQTFDERVAFLSMFFLAISPWHILLSRWSLESNLFPFVFLIGYLCLLNFRRGGAWFVVACALFGLCLYAYGTAYAVIPVFILITVVLVMRNKLIHRTAVIAGLGTFVIMAAPIGLLILVNAWRLPPIMLGPLTVPRFPVEARFEAATVIGASGSFHSIVNNLWVALRLLATETDGILYNVVDPYGYFYRISLPAAVFGLVVLIHGLTRGARVEVLFLLAWIGSSFLIAVFQDVNINRFNIIFMPLLLCTAYAIEWLDARLGIMLPVSVVILLTAFAFFTAAYHGASYRRQVDWKFDQGLLPALRYAQGVAENGICVTDKINMPYIFALFSEPINPTAYLGTVRYVDPQAPLRQVAAFGRYTFGTQNCPDGSPFTYILTTDEIPPRLGNRYQYEFFDNFVVYSPKP